MDIRKRKRKRRRRKEGPSSSDVEYMYARFSLTLADKKSFLFPLSIPRERAEGGGTAKLVRRERGGGGGGGPTFAFPLFPKASFSSSFSSFSSSSSSSSGHRPLPPQAMSTTEFNNLVINIYGKAKWLSSSVKAESEVFRTTEEEKRGTERGRNWAPPPPPLLGQEGGGNREFCSTLPPPFSHTSVIT